MLAVITLDFDPILRFDGFEVRAETVLLAATLLAALLMAARIAKLTPQPGPYVPAPPLDLGDLPFLVLGIVAGAVVGGRLDYVLLHLDYYLAHPAAIADPGQGGLSLTLAVVGGLGGAVAIARLVAAPAGAWMHASALPALFVLAGGKLAGVLAGDGQGAPSDLPWATAYVGPGPWASLAPELASHPAQVYEAIGATILVVLLGLALRLGAFGRRDGAALVVAILGWVVVRAGVALTWRDAEVLGPLRAEHGLLVVAAGLMIGALVRLRRTRGSTIPVR